MSETRRQQEIMLEFGKYPEFRLWRNQVGGGWVGKATKRPDGSVIIQNAKFVRFGLPEGSTDLIGWRTRTIGKDDLGKSLAQFVAVEIKTTKGRLQPNQKRFLALAENMGCEAHVLTDASDVQEIVHDEKRRAK